MPDLSPRQILIRAKKLIENEEDWYGNHQENWKDKLCSVQAIGRVFGPNASANVFWTGCSSAMEIFKKAMPPEYNGDIVTYNDTNPHQAIMSTFDRAIEAAP